MPESTADVRLLSPREAHELAAAGRAVLVDLRIAPLFENAHIQDAVLVAIGRRPREQFAQFVDQLPGPPAILALYCACLGDTLAFVAAEEFAAAGVPAERLAVLDGGIAAWHRAGLPIETWNGVPPAEFA